MDEIPIPATDAVPLDGVAADLVGLSIAFVNVFGIRGEAGWTLIDAGVPGSAGRIKAWAREHFGDEPPTSIVLTHAHFDHAGALHDLVEAWGAPVYAHAEEIEYAAGLRAYPPPDPSVGGGMMARLSALYPRKVAPLGRHVSELPADGQLRDLAGWRWIHTPGHTAGHISLFRDVDRTLVVGDAFCTTRPEEFFSAVLTQRPELHGPPAYFTTDWDAARDSVRTLAALHPDIVAPGHGKPMSGAATRAALSELAERFDELARPAHGRYVEQPVR